MIKSTLGGIRTPRAPPAAIHPVVSFLSYLYLNISGIASFPIVAVVAVLAPEIAAKIAQDYSNTFLIKKDISTAYSLLSDNIKANITEDNFRSLMNQIHPEGFPLQVDVVAYEPMPGQASMYIFLEGKKENEIFNYRFLMEGTKAKGYKVLGINRNIGPYPLSKLRKTITVK